MVFVCCRHCFSLSEAGLPYGVMQQNSQHENEMRNPHLSTINYLAANCMEIKPKILISMIICVYLPSSSVSKRLSLK
jgi:hypothetical protein